MLPLVFGHVFRYVDEKREGVDVLALVSEERRVGRGKQVFGGGPSDLTTL